jgi:replication initiation and membrane attachment protein DnaB
MKVLTPEVYAVCYQFASYRCNGDIRPIYLETICKDVLARGISTPKEAYEHFNSWIKEQKGNAISRNKKSNTQRGN